MKILLNIVIALLVVSCNSRIEQKQIKEELVTESTDTVKFTKPFLNDKQNLLIESKEPRHRKKTISFDSLTRTPCNIDVILYTHENIDSLSKDAIDLFLNVFSVECNNNVEFSEFSQKIIFDVFAKYPEEVTELITQKNYNLNAIKSELESPLLDPIIEPIVLDIKSTGIKNAKIDSVIAALERGIKYLNGE